MIRNHRPRGFLWSCPSLFQQTHLFRNINVADCAAPLDDDATSDSEDDFPLSVRAAKRRRLARVADDFLNGTELEIPSATLVPADIRHAVASTFESNKQGWRALAEFEPEETPEIEDPMDWWEVVYGHDEILQAFLAPRNVSCQDRVFPAAGHDFIPEEDLVVTEEQAQASCGLKNRLRSAAKVTFGLSDHALRQAAGLRNCRLLKSESDHPAESQTQSCPRPVVPESQDQPSPETEETTSDCGPSPTPAWTSSKWIRSGVFELRKKKVDEECSRDELGASSIFTPSQRSHARLRLLARAHTAASRVASQSFNSTPPPAATSLAATSFASQYPGLDMLAHSHPNEARGSERHDYRGLEVSPTRVAGVGNSDDDSQTRLRRQHSVRATARTSWTTINDVTERSDESHPHFDASLEIEQRLSGPAGAVASEKRKAMSTGDPLSQASTWYPMRRCSVPPESQSAAEQTRKLSAHQGMQMDSFKTQFPSAAIVSGGSPFVSRKRGSNINNDEDLDVKHISASAALKVPAKTPRRIAFPSCNSVHATRKSAGSHVVNGSGAPNPHTPLVNEHLNSILPMDVDPGTRVSSLRKSLRDELIASGAELSTYEDDHLSQPDAASEEPLARDLEIESAREAESQRVQTWPGTQVLLAQAHQDLFTSLDMTNISLYLGEKTTPQCQTSSDGDRRPLQQLSQEPAPMPSTQTLLDDWEGWSSVKKRRSFSKRQSITQSPSTGKDATTIVSFGAIPLHEVAERRRSSLRFSVSFTDSPKQLRVISLPSRLPLSTAPESLMKSSGGFHEFPVKQKSGGIMSSFGLGYSTLAFSTQPQTRQEVSQRTDDSLGFGEPFPSHQNAQNPVMRDIDSQELDQTMTELICEVLGTAKQGAESSGF